MTGAEPSLAPLEVLAGAPGAERPPRRWTYVALALVLTVLTGAWWLDSRARQDELGAFAAQVVSGQQAIDRGEAKVAAMLAYGQPLLSRADVPADVRADLQGIVAEAQLEAAESLEAERTATAALTGPSWHGELERARTAYLEYLDDRIGTFTAAGTGAAPGSVPDPAVAVALARARSAAADASAGSPDVAATLDTLLSP